MQILHGRRRPDDEAEQAEAQNADRCAQYVHASCLLAACWRAWRGVKAQSISRCIRVGVFERAAAGGFVEVGRGGVAAVDVLVIEHRHAEFVHARDIFARVAGMDAVVLGRGEHERQSENPRRARKFW